MDCILYVYSNMSRYISIRCNSDLSMYFPLQQVYTRRELNYTIVSLIFKTIRENKGLKGIYKY